MLWSEKYRNEIADAMRAGREEAFKKSYEEGFAEGFAEGLAKGAREYDAQLARLAQELEARGRSSELIPALEDTEKHARLLDEFGIKRQLSDD